METPRYFSCFESHEILNYLRSISTVNNKAIDNKLRDYISLITADEYIEAEFLECYNILFLTENILNNIWATITIDIEYDYKQEKVYVYTNNYNQLIKITMVINQ
jgi:hypothetical protein